MGETNNAEGERPEPYDRTQQVTALLAWLDRAGVGAIPTRIATPIDLDELQRARHEAKTAAIQSGRADELQAYQRQIMDWAFAMFRRHGLNAIYFTGHSSPAAAKAEAIQVLLDAMTAYLLADVMSGDSTVTLLTRLDVVLGGALVPGDEASV